MSRLVRAVSTPWKATGGQSIGPRKAVGMPVTGHPDTGAVSAGEQMRNIARRMTAAEIGAASEF